MVEFSVEQIGERDVVDVNDPNTVIIDKNYIHWISDQPDSEVLLTLNVQTRNTTEISLDNLQGRPLTDGDRGDFIEGGSLIIVYDLGPDPENNIFSNNLIHNFYNGESVNEIPNFLDIPSTSLIENYAVRTFENFVTWVQDDNFLIFDGTDVSLNQIPLQIARTPLDSSFVNSSSVNENNELEPKVYWIELGNLDTATKIFFFNGTETLEINSGVNISILAEDSNSDSIAYSVYDDNTQTYDLYIFNGAENSQIPTSVTTFEIQAEVSETQFVISDERAAWVTYSDETEKYSINFYNGSEILVAYEIDPSFVNNPIRDLTIAGENVVWIAENDSLPDQLFLYDGNETIELATAPSNNSFFPSLQVSDRYVAWTLIDDNGQDQLYIYDGNEIVQLTDISRQEGNFIVDYEILDNGVFWVANIDGDSDEDIIGVDYGGEIFLATIEEENSQSDDNSDEFISPDEDVDIVPNGIYRFFNNNTGVHFYTGNETEIEAIQELDNFSSEGISYVGADPLTGVPEPSPIYRFLNQDTGVHLYTISETERDVVSELDNFSFEGEAFFAYDTQIENSIPIYRFLNSNTGAHFYTSSLEEKNSINSNLLDFQSEGVAYYAFPATNEDIV